MSGKKQENFKSMIDEIKDLIRSPYPRPKRDWAFMLSFFFVTLVVLALINSLMFFYWSDTGEIESFDPATFSDEGSLVGAGVMLDMKKMDNVWDFFNDKNDRFEDIQNDWTMDSPLSGEDESVDVEADAGEIEEQAVEIETEDDVEVSL